MPYQSRGFWCCDFCKLTLDSFDEARQHELQECQKNPNQAEQQQQQQQQQQPPQHFQPYSTPQQLQRGPAHFPGYYPPTAAMAPINPTVGAAAAQKPDGSDYEASSGGLRTFPLLGPNESSQMNTEDTVACQSCEIFEANQIQASELRSQYPSLVAGQLGLRCIHCSSSNDPAAATAQSKDAVVFPANVESLADNVQILCDRHLGNCGAAPSQVRDIARQAAEKRRQNQQQEQQRGHSWQEAERSSRVLQEWCFHFCRRLGIVDKGPNAAGLFFSHSYHPMERHPGLGHPGRPAPGMAAAPPEQLAPTPLAHRRARSYETPYAVQGGEQQGYYPEAAAAAAMPTPGQEGPDSQQQRGVSPHGDFQQQLMPQFDLPPNFPFFQEPNGSWSCKYCSHIHPQYRDPQSMWAAPNHMPPPGQFIDQHLSMCRAYHQAVPPQHMFQGPHPSQFPFMNPQMAGGFGPPQQEWEGQGQGPHGFQGSLPQPLPFHPHAGPVDPTQMHAPFPHTPHQMPGNTKYGDVGSGGGAVQQSRSHNMNTPAPPRPEASDAAVQNAIDYLSAHQQEPSFTPGTNESDQLVLDEDRLLLTDYFFHLMKQLRLVRFSESDRKTRGGKREKIKIGFGGLQCIHCADANNSRKFFWSNVDRLANSFAEIPGHVLKCRHCPQPTKDALYQLKQLHPEQMARLPRGSQKVFFRRMWRRLHPEEFKNSPGGDGSLGLAPSADSADVKSPAVEAKSGNESSPSGTTGSDESILLLQRSTKEAAKALADSTSSSLPPSPTSRVLLAIPDDKEWLSDTDCFIRRQIEVFCASSEDVSIARNDRKFPIHKGQVGIRCIHCSLAKQGYGARGSGVAYPFSISGIYESVREFQRLHLDTCDNLPSDLKAKLSDLKGSTSLSSVLRKYYVLAAKALGLKDTQQGIHAGADSVPLGSQAAFAFSDGTPSVSDEMRRSTMSYAEASSPDSRKRKPHEGPESSETAKRPHSS